MEPKRKKSFDERIVKDIERGFPSPDPETHRYVVEKDKYSFYLYDSLPSADKPGEWVMVPGAKFSFLEGDRLWQVSWMPPQGRWQKYGRYFDLDTAMLIVKGDPAGCFTGHVSPLAYLKEKGKG